jgi:hypothetical protein
MLKTLTLWGKSTTGQLLSGEVYTVDEATALLSEKQDILKGGVNISKIFGLDPTDATNNPNISAISEINATSSMPVTSAALYSEFEKKISTEDADLKYAALSDFKASNGCVHIYIAGETPTSSATISSDVLSKYALVEISGTLDALPFSMVYPVSDLISGKTISAFNILGTTMETACFTYTASDGLLAAVSGSCKKISFSDLSTIPDSVVLILSVYGILESSNSKGA